MIAILYRFNMKKDLEKKFIEKTNDSTKIKTDFENMKDLMIVGGYE